MENNTLWVGISGMVLGFIIGAICFGAFGMWGGRGMMDGQYSGNNMHMMNNSSMMNESMNMDSMMHAMMGGLSGKTGDAFDKAFIKEMIIHHEGAVLMAQAALDNAKHPEIKTMANAIISAQTSEVNQMKSWLVSWYGEDYTENNSQ